VLIGSNYVIKKLILIAIENTKVTLMQRCVYVESDEIGRIM